MSKDAIKIDTSAMYKVLEKRVAKLKFKLTEIDKVMNPPMRTMYKKVINTAYGKTRLGKKFLKSRIGLSNVPYNVRGSVDDKTRLELGKKLRERMRKKGILYYRRIYVKGSAGIIHTGWLLTPRAKATGRGKSRGMTIKGKRYPGAFIHPKWKRTKEKGPHKGKTIRRVMQRKPGTSNKLEAVTLDISLIKDVVRRGGPIFVKRLTRQAHRNLRRLYQKKLSGTIKK